MICICVTPKSRQLAKVDLLNAARQCDLVELCLDHLVKEPDIPDLLQSIDKPIMISCRRKADGGQWEGDEDQRLALLRTAIVAGPDYVELDFDAAAAIPRFGKTKRVVSYTNLEKPLKRVDNLVEEATRLHADVIKFTWPTPTLDAAWPLLAAVCQEQDVPIVGLGLGRAGVTFSLLGRKYKSPWIYAALERGMEAFPGQPTVGELDETFRWRDIDAKTRFVGVVGFGHGETTAVHLANEGFRQLEQDTRCLPLSVVDLDKLAKRLETLRTKAVIVGPAFGEHYIDFADVADALAKKCRYTDLLLKQPDGWSAYATLWRSTLLCLENSLDGAATPDERPLNRRNVLVLGSGGLARVLAAGIERRKGLVSIAGSDDGSTQQAAEQLGIRYVPIANLYDTLCDVAVIADHRLKPGHSKTTLNPAFLKPPMTVVDASQLPGEGPLLKEARDRGCTIVEPADIFRHYFRSVFKSVAGEELPAEAIEALSAEL